MDAAAAALESTGTSPTSSVTTVTDTGTTKYNDLKGRRRRTSPMLLLEPLPLVTLQTLGEGGVSHY